MHSYIKLWAGAVIRGLNEESFNQLLQWPLYIPENPLIDKVSSSSIVSNSSVSIGSIAGGLHAVGSLVSPTRNVGKDGISEASFSV